MLDDDCSAALLICHFDNSSDPSAESSRTDGETISGLVPRASQFHASWVGLAA